MSRTELELRIQLAHVQAVLDELCKVVTIAQLIRAENAANLNGYSLETLYALAELRGEA